jgi:hypothetical protein
MKDIRRSTVHSPDASILSSTTICVHLLAGLNATGSTNMMVTIPKAGSMRGEEGGGEPVMVNLHISGNDIVNDMKITKKINQAGGKRERHFR